MSSSALKASGTRFIAATLVALASCGPLSAQGTHGPSGIAAQDVERAMADALVQSNQIGEALVVVQRLVGRYPTDVELRRTQVWLRERKGDSRGALADQEALVSMLRGQATFGDRVHLIRLQRLGGKRGESSRALASLTIPNNLPGEEALELAGLLVETGGYQKAAQLLDGLDARTRETTGALSLLATVEARRGNHAEAAGILEKLMSRKDAAPGIAFEVVNEWNAAGRPGRALDLARELLNAQVTPDQALFVAQLAVASKDVNLARQALAAIPPRARTAAIELTRAEVARLDGKLPEARAILEAAVSRFPKDAPLIRALAGALLDSSEPARALALIAPLADGRGAIVEDLAIALRARHAVLQWEAGHATAARLAQVAARSRADRVRAAAALAFENKPRFALDLLGLAETERNTTDWKVAHARAAYDVGASGQALARLLGAIEPARLNADQALAMAELAYRAQQDRQALAFLMLVGAGERSQARRAAALAARIEWRMSADPVRTAAAAKQALLLHTDEDGPALDVAGLQVEVGAYDDARATLARFPVKRQAHAVRALQLKLAWESSGARAYDELLAQPVAPVDEIDRDPFTDLDLAGMTLDRGRPEAAIAEAQSARVPPWGRARQQILVARAELAGKGRSPARERLVKMGVAKDYPEDERLDVADGLMSVPDSVEASRVLAPTAPAGSLVWKKQVLEARMYVRQARFVEAFDVIRKMMPAAMQDPWTMRKELANVLIEARRTELGRELAGRLPEWWLATYDGRKMLTGLAILERRGQEVMDRANKMLEERPDDADAIHLHAQGRLLLRHWPEALAEHDALIARSPEREEYHLGRAQALLGLDRAPEALAVTQAFQHRALGEGQTVSLNTELALAQALNQADRPKEALAIQDRVLSLLPDDANLIKERAGTLAYLDRHEEAVSELDRATKIAGKMIPADYVQRGASLRWTKGRDAAREDYLAALAIDGKDRDALRSLASLQSENLETREQAIETYHKLLRVDPLDIGRVGLASVLLDLGHVELAQKELENVRSRVPSNRELGMTTISWRLARQEPNAAHRQWRELVASRPLDPGAWIALSQIDGFQGAGFRQEAVRAAEYARQLTPKRIPILRQAALVEKSQGIISHEFEDGSDTLRREKTTVGLYQAQINHGEVEAGLVMEQNKLQRAGNRETWTDAHGRVNWNPKNEHSVSADVVVGEAAGHTDVLPAVEYRFTPRRGLWGSVGLARERVIDAPEALQAGLKQDRVRVAGGKAWGRVRTELGAVIDAIDDGNTRRQYYARTRYTVHAPFVLSYDFENRSSEFEPNPFTLYFAPSNYRQHAAGLELIPLYWGKWQVGGRLVRVLDNLDGLPGEGSIRGISASRIMGGRSLLNLNVSHLENSVARRIGVNAPFRQTTANLAYQWTL